MIRLQFIGNIGGDATIRQMQDGTNAISFTVAPHTEKRKDQEFTTWISCTIWKRADQPTNIVQYLKKGQKVYVEGKPSVRAYAKQDGTQGASLDVRVDSLELLGGGTQTAAPAPAAQPRQQQPNVVTAQFTQSNSSDDDLPF